MINFVVAHCDLTNGEMGIEKITANNKEEAIFKYLSLEEEDFTFPLSMDDIEEYCCDRNFAIHIDIL